MTAFLDLFAGAGGFSWGLHAAGWTGVGAVEADRFAAKTYRRNLPSTTLFEQGVESCSDGWLRDRFAGVDAVVGGPPCQGFSVAGPRQYGRVDPRNSLILQMARVASVLLPAIVVLENVRGVLAGRNSAGGRAIEQYEQAMEQAGFQTRRYVLQAADFGVPQHRQRVFLVSGRRGIVLPEEVPPSFGTPDRPWRSAWDGLSDLPALGPGQGAEQPVAYAAPPANDYQVAMRQDSAGVTNHLCMRHTPRIVERIRSIPVGGSMKTYRGANGQRQRNDHTVDARPVYKMNYSRLDPGRPSLSVPANFQAIHVHPEQHRMLTAREGARLQSFPDRFVFTGPRTLMSRKLLLREGRHDEIGLSQYNQVGNAVPPLMAQALGEALSTCLR